MVKLTMMVGLPASGKSLIAKCLACKWGTRLHSSDDLRLELYGDANTQGNNNDLFEELHKRIKTDLSNGLNVVYDATNLNAKKRKNFLESLNKLDVHKEAIVMATPYNICLERNKNRDRQVPEHVIKRMREKFNIPIKQEGFDNISIKFSDDWNKAGILKDMLYIDSFNQENSHHILTLGNHCMEASCVLQNSNQRLELQMSGLLHDIGKLYTKTFINISDGSKSESAHYYGHENVGAYESLFMLRSEDIPEEIILKISALINYHMRPYFLKSEKSTNKFKKFIGSEMFDEIMLLHEADKLAH